jgi:hypothetical protein
MVNQLESIPKFVKSEIISCSRRTDIPAFLMDWVIQRIKTGYVDVVNPFNRKQISRVSLSPKYTKCFVWWSKNFKEWIRVYQENKPLFNAYKGHVFQFTINSPSELEPNIRISLEERFKQAEWLINKFGLPALNFRFDPIIFYKKRGSNEILHNLNKFEYIVKELSKFGVKELIFSFATLYKKVQNRMNYRGFIPIDLSLDEKRHFLRKLVEICNETEVHMKACCQPDLLSIDGIEQAHCIDAYKIENIIGETIIKVKDTGQRKECGCYKSKDIGGYTGIFKCKHNCSYCYASPSKR